MSLVLFFFGILLNIFCLTADRSWGDNLDQNQRQKSVTSKFDAVRKKLIEDRLKLLKMEKEITDRVRRKLMPESEKVRNSNLKYPVPFDQAREQEKYAKKMKEIEKTLSPKELQDRKRKFSEWALMRKKIQSGEIKPPLDPKKEEKTKENPKAKGQALGASALRKIESSAPSSTGKPKTFGKGVDKNPTEYGNSTATPGEAEKEVIEFPGQPKK